MYFITMLEGKDGLGRCVGYVSDFNEAEKIVKNNMYDIWEHIYEYAIIEEIDEGIYQWCEYPKWHKYNKEENKYESCERPEWAK